MGKITTAFEVYLKDLDKETRKAVLEFYGYENAEAGNLDICPLFVLEKETKDENK